MRREALLTIFPLFLTGCGTYTPREVANPPEVTVVKAFADVGDGLNVLSAKTKGHKYGLIADEITIDFNISSKATSDNHLGITSDKIPIGNTVFGLDARAAVANESNRGNHITVKLKNIATAELKGNTALIEHCVKHPDDCSVLFNRPVASQEY